jgi:hypothetical protein
MIRSLLIATLCLSSTVVVSVSATNVPYTLAKRTDKAQIPGVPLERYLPCWITCRTSECWYVASPYHPSLSIFPNLPWLPMINCWYLFLALAKVLAVMRVSAAGMFALTVIILITRHYPFLPTDLDPWLPKINCWCLFLALVELPAVRLVLWVVGMSLSISLSLSLIIISFSNLHWLPIIHCWCPFLALAEILAVIVIQAAGMLLSLSLFSSPIIIPFFPTYVDFQDSIAVPCSSGDTCCQTGASGCWYVALTFIILITHHCPFSPTYLDFQ